MLQKTSGKLDNPLTFFMKYYQDISFVKLLRTFLHSLGDNKLFKTILATMEDNGPVVVKAYLTKHARRNSAANDELMKYKSRLEDIRKTLSLLQHPNTMPYQRLVLDEVWRISR